METNLILAGVGGQGILSISVVIDMAALKLGWNFKQAEVHGMSQRGGEVHSHLRLSDRPIHSDLVPHGAATLVLSVEPMEALRYVDYLSPQGALVSSIEPFENISDYPQVEGLLEAIAALPNHTLIASEALAREAGSARAQNMVLLGAASPYLGIPEKVLEEGILELFARKGEKVQRTNIDAFRAGKAAGESYRACLAAGIPSKKARPVVSRLSRGALDPDAVTAWSELLSGPLSGEVLDAVLAEKSGRVPGKAAVPKQILSAGRGAKLSEMLFKV